MVMLDRGDYWQCAYVIPKGGYDASAPRSAVAPGGTGAVPPAAAERLDQLTSWDDIKLLTVTIDRLSAGRSRDCCASATRRTRCHRWAASGSIWRFRTRSQRPTSWCPAARRRACTRPTCRRSSAGGRFRCASFKGCKSSRRNRIFGKVAPQRRRRTRRRRCRFRCGCSRFSVAAMDFGLCLGVGPAPNTCTRPRYLLRAVWAGRFRVRGLGNRVVGDVFEHRNPVAAERDLVLVLDLAGDVDALAARREGAVFERSQFTVEVAFEVRDVANRIDADRAEEVRGDPRGAVGLSVIVSAAPNQPPASTPVRISESAPRP